MERTDLSIAFGDSLGEEVVTTIGELSEVGLDSFVDEGVLKAIPFVSTAISIYKIGNSLKERHNLRKMVVFLNEINLNIVSEEKRLEYKKKFQINEKFRNQEMEYLLVLIDRYISYEKPKMLAKLYLAYLDGIIVWEEMTMYSEIIDRFLILDYKTLMSDADRFIVHRNIGDEVALRLVGLGLMTDITNRSPYKERANGNIGMTWESLKKSQSNDKVYKRTEFGEKLARILRL